MQPPKEASGPELTRKSELDSAEKGKSLFVEGLGNVTVTSTKDSRYFRRNKKHYTEKEFKDDVARTAELVKRAGPELYSPVDYSCGTDKMLCVTSHYLSQYFHVLYPSLKNEVKNREKSKIDFSPAELVSIYHRVLTALNTLGQRGGFHGDVRPSKVIFNPRTLEAKLTDNFDEIPDVEAMKAVQKQHVKVRDPVYLSPASYEAYHANKVPTDLDPHTEDLNALALMLLELSHPRLQNYFVKGVAKKEEIKKAGEEFVSKIKAFDESYTPSLNLLFDLGAKRNINSLILSAPPLSYTVRRTAQAAEQFRQTPVSTSTTTTVTTTHVTTTQAGETPKGADVKLDGNVSGQSTAPNSFRVGSAFTSNFVGPQGTQASQTVTGTTVGMDVQIPQPVGLGNFPASAFGQQRPIPKSASSIDLRAPAAAPPSSTAAPAVGSFRPGPTSRQDEHLDHVFIRANKSVERPKTVFFDDPEVDVIELEHPFSKSSLMRMKRSILGSQFSQVNASKV